MIFFLSFLQCFLWYIPGYLRIYNFLVRQRQLEKQDIHSSSFGTRFSRAFPHEKFIAYLCTTQRWIVEKCTQNLWTYFVSIFPENRFLTEAQFSFNKKVKKMYTSPHQQSYRLNEGT